MSTSGSNGRKVKVPHKGSKRAENRLQLIVLKGSDLNNLCKPYRTKTILHGAFDPILSKLKKDAKQEIKVEVVDPATLTKE